MHMSAPLAIASHEEKKIMVNIVKMELAHQQRSKARAAIAQAERARTVEASRNRLLAEKLDADRKAMARRDPLLVRMIERVADIWSMAYGTVLAVHEAFILWGIRYGLLEYVEN